MGYIGIDIGSSFIKAAFLDVKKFEISEIVKIEAPDFIFKDKDNCRMKEIDADKVFVIVKGIIDDYVSKHNAVKDGTDKKEGTAGGTEGTQGTEGIEGILFSTQMHGFILTGGDGNRDPATNYITWQDERSLCIIDDTGETYLQRLESLLDSEDFRKSGTRLKPSLAISNLCHWTYNNRNRADENLIFCTLGDYVIMKLTGGEPMCHLTNAASTGMVDLTTGSWNADVINKLGFGNIRFPQIVTENTVCGIYNAPGDASVKVKGRGIPVYPAVGDHQAAMSGAFLRPGRDLAINIGTGSQLCMVSENLVFGSYETRPFFDGAYLKAITHIPAGRSLNVLVDFIKDIGIKIFDLQPDEKAIWQKIDSYISGDTGETDLDVNISFFKTSALPCGGHIGNINEKNLKVDGLFYAAMKNMAGNFYALHKLILADGGKPEKIICAGGLVRKSPVLLKMIEEAFGLPVSLTPYTEDTLTGLMRLAVICSKNPEGTSATGLFEP